MTGIRRARVVIGDYVAHRTARRLLVGFLLALCVIWLLLGIAVIAFFDPDAVAATTSRLS